MSDDHAHHMTAASLPFAGRKLSDKLQGTLHLDGDGLLWDGEQPYLHINGYLIPHYKWGTGPFLRESIERRNEELIIDRAYLWSQNAIGELSVLRSAEQIQQVRQEIFGPPGLPESTPDKIAYKANRISLLVGSIVQRFATLGRATLQGNTHGVMLESSIPVSPVERRLKEEDIEKLKAEFSTLYFQILTDPKLAQWQHFILRHNEDIDRDGVLIDLTREIGKPLKAHEEAREAAVRDHIVKKIGWAMESIDLVRDELRTAIKEEPTAQLFAGACENFFETRGGRYSMHSVAEVLHKLDEYADLCRARACIKSDDVAYDEIVARKRMLKGFFNEPNGLLQSMRRAGRHGSSSEVQELRQLLSRGIRLMDDVSFTRTPCNKEAPEPWIPKVGILATPIDRYMNEHFLSLTEWDRAKAIWADDRMKIERKVGETDEDFKARTAELFTKMHPFFAEKFCSLGCLQGGFEHLRSVMAERAEHGNGKNGAPRNAVNGTDPQGIGLKGEAAQGHAAPTTGGRANS